MTPIRVVPAGLTKRVERLCSAMGWEVTPSSAPAGDPGAAFRLAAAGEPVLFVARMARIPRALRLIVVVHCGTRAERAGIDAAVEAARATGAEIRVLYLPIAQHPGPANLQFRFSDHAEHDWAEWSDEFDQRFCRCPDGVRHSVALAVGPGAHGVGAQAKRLGAGLIVAHDDGGVDPRRAAALESIAASAPAPVLIVPRPPVPVEP